MKYKRRARHYLTLTPAEASLAIRALLRFRNKVVAHGNDPVDIDVIIKRLA